MIRIARVVVAALLLSQSAAAQLNKLIEENVNSQTSSANRLANEPQKNSPQLWIHVRSEDQKQVVVGNLDWFRSLEVGGRKVEVRPIQMVNEGPQQSQLRFFRQTDQSQAEALLAEIRKAVPLTVLQDMSKQYQQVQWIEPGHYELWLAPNVARIAPELTHELNLAASPAAGYSCDGRTHCSQMKSCAEAIYFLRNCPGTKKNLDSDNDGVPCKLRLKCK